MKRIVTLAALLAAPTLAAAHDFWVEPAEGGFVVRYGHRGEESLPIDAASVKAIRCLDAAGHATDILAAARFAPKEIRFAGPCAVVSVLREGGYRSLTPAGVVRLPKNRAANVVRAWASRDFAKWIDARGPGAGAAVGAELELVVPADLARARPGDAVTVRVLSAGQPVPSAAVEVGERTVGRTDARGELRVRLAKPGLQTVVASIRRPHPTPEADADALEASLTFEVGR